MLRSPATILAAAVMTMVITAGLITQSSPDAHACGNARRALDQDVYAVKMLVWKLDQEQYRDVIGEAVRGFPQIMPSGKLIGKQAHHEHVSSLGNLERRALKYAAIAIVRSEGKWSVATSPQPVTGDGARASKLQWAENVLGSIAKVNRKQRVYHAEALAALDGSSDKALAMFRELDGRNRIYGGHSWLAYADLLDAAGEEAEAAQARKRGERKVAQERARPQPEGYERVGRKAKVMW